MKHIFYLTNNTAYLVAKKIIEQKNLQENDCAYLLGNFSLQKMLINDEIKTAVYDQKKIKFRKWTFVITWFYLMKLSLKILMITGYKNFIFYVPHTGSFDKYFIKSFPLCKEINYIEEGLLSYRNVFSSKKFEGLRNIIFLKLNFLGIVPGEIPLFNYNEGNKFYALHKQSFEDFSEKRILLNFKSSQTFGDYSQGAIIAISRISEHTWISIEDHLEVIGKVIDGIDKSLSIWIKHHPRQSDKVIEAIKELVKVKEKQGYKISILDSTFSIEKALSENKNLTLFSDFSSLLIYALTFGQESVSYYNLLSTKSQKLQDKAFLNFFPPNLRAQIKMIDAETIN